MKDPHNPGRYLKNSKRYENDTDKFGGISVFFYFPKFDRNRGSH